jgi:hypothetical protein
MHGNIITLPVEDPKIDNEPAGLERAVGCVFVAALDWDPKRTTGSLIVAQT